MREGRQPQRTAKVLNAFKVLRAEGPKIYEVLSLDEAEQGLAMIGSIEPALHKRIRISMEQGYGKSVQKRGVG